MNATQHWTHSETELLAYLSGDLDPASCARYEAHLQDCANCRASVAAELTRLEAEPEVPEAKRQRMSAEFEELLRAQDRPLRTRRRRPFYLLAAALAASVLVSVAILRQQPTELDDATLALLARADQELPETLSKPLWIPVSARSIEPAHLLGGQPDSADFDGLLADLEVAEANWPDDDELRLTLAHAQLAAGNPVAAALNYRDLLDAPGQANRARIGLAASLHVQGQLAEALELLREIPEQAPEARAALFDRAYLHLELDQTEQAKQLALLYKDRFGEDIWYQDLEIRLSRHGG